MQTKTMRQSALTEQRAVHAQPAGQRMSVAQGTAGLLSSLQRSHGNQFVQRTLAATALQPQADEGEEHQSAPKAIASIPSEEDSDVIDMPGGIGLVPMISDVNGDGGGGSGGASGGATPTATICDQPISMNKVTSATFLGGLSMDDYYPDLAGKGFWEHGNTGGPFDTGSRVGSNVQLWGDIRIPCDPSKFSLAQTVKYTRAIFDGVHHPKEGVVQDDIAKSGRDFSRPPARQEFGAGGGWAISMADPPSMGYTATTNAEFDREFVTSLVGSGGRRSVSWSTSIRVVNGSVTRNTIT